MRLRSILRPGLAMLAVIAVACASARAAEHVTLRNGFELDCARQEPVGDRVRLYLLPAAGSQGASSDVNYIEVSASAVLRVDAIPDPLATAPASVAAPLLPLATSPALTSAEMRPMLDRAGALHNVDADLLASVIHAESNGNALAVSRAGAQGLMQLMPSTAAELGVHDSFAPEQNIGGGTAYLDALLMRYHNDMRLAVAAYNAGPAVVDRYHGIPPYTETRAYVARVVSEFNRRKRAALASHTSLIAAAVSR